MGNQGIEPIELLVADGEQSFTDAITDSLDVLETSISVEVVATTDEAIEYANDPDTQIDCVMVGDRLRTPIDTIRELTEGVDRPTILLTDSLDDEEMITDAVEAGISDYYSRTTTVPHCELISKRITSELSRGRNAQREIFDPTRQEQEYRQIFNKVNDAIVVHDPQTEEIIDINEAMIDLVEADRETILEEGVSGISVAAEGYTEERAYEIMRRVVENGEPEIHEWLIETANGESRWVEANITPALIHGEHRALIISRNITERKRREREYEQIFNGVQDAIIVMDPETLDILDANEAYLDMVGYDDLKSVQEQGVEGLSATTEGYTVDEGKRIHRRVAETGEPEVVEWQAETQGGERRWLEIKVASAVISGDEVNVAIHRDVTERRRTKRRLRTIIERIDEAIYFSRADKITNPSLHPDDLSAGYEHIWGQPLEEIFANNEGGFFDTIHPEEKDEFETFIEELGDDIEAGTEADRYSREYRIERPDGEIRWIRSDFYPTEWDTGPLRIVIVSRDITDRKEREQRIASFHDATRKLTTADSREGACRQAVTAAEQVLGLPVVSAHLYTEDTGQLDPVACTRRLEKPNRDLPSFGPGDSLPWQVYVEGEAVTNIESETEIYESSVSESEIILPLGSHGVMLVGASTEALDSEDIELTQILAATLEAALNHVAGERVLAEREEQLRQHQKRADQLERLNAIIRDIEQATVEQSSRAAIEEAVCERLIDVDPHQFVWIGEPSIRDDELLPRIGVGGKESYIDSLTIDLEAGAGAHPAVRVFQDGTSKMVKNVATDATKGEWRKTALRHGIQSVVAAPISYEDTIHGILTVASDEPQAFDESIQDVFEELGRSIGYAITVTEREESLESERTTELEFSVSDEGLFFVRGSEVESCHLRLERTIRRSGGSFSTFYLVEGGDPGRLVELATTALNVESAQVISANEADKTGLIEVTAPTWFGSEFTDQGAVVREASATDGDGVVVIETPQEADVRTLAERFQEHYPETEVIAKRQRERTIRSLFEVQDILQDELTDRQWEALQTAYSAGYFAWPRESSGEEVAGLLNVTQPTFNKHIRLAEQRAIEILMERDHPTSKGEG